MSKYIGYYMRLVLLVAFLIGLFVINSRDIMAAYEEGDVSNSGTITGTVTLAGDVPVAKSSEVEKDQEACGHEPKPSEALLVSSDNNVETAVVSITNILRGKKFNDPGENVTLDQKGCVFVPHVLMIPPKSTVNLLNSDSVMHNLHSWSIKNTTFNEGVAGGGTLLKTFEFPEVVKITCDVHKWMNAWLIIQDNPYFSITDKNGNFQINDVPPGTFKVQVWQESLGKVTQEVTVKAGEETRVAFEMKQKKKRRRRVK